MWNSEFRVSVRLDGAAFETGAERTAELRRLMIQVADDLYLAGYGVEPEPLIDINGNTVGSAGFYKNSR